MYMEFYIKRRFKKLIGCLPIQYKNYSYLQETYNSVKYVLHQIQISNYLNFNFSNMNLKKRKLMKWDLKIQNLQIFWCKCTISV